MSFSKIIKEIGFTYSFKRLKKAILLVVLFTLIGLGVYFLYRFESSESGLKIAYEKEISSIVDLADNTIIKIYKQDLNDDQVLDYVFIMGKEKRSSENALNSTLEVYNDVSLVVIDGASSEEKIYETKKDYKPATNLEIIDSKNEKYFLIYDETGSVDLLKLEGNSLVNIIKNTTSDNLLGYTIYTSKNEENESILEVTLDNYGKDYLKKYEETKILDFSDLSVDLSKYRETYLRDKISKFEFKNIDEDEELEFVTTQYILYGLDDSVTENKTIGKIEIYFNINDDKLVFDKVEINI